jgi:hypothetical protein
MSAIPYESHDEAWEATDQEAFAPPGRPRRRFFNRKSAALAALLTCAAGFYGGISIEKGQLASTASAATTSATGAAAGATATGAGASAGGGFAGRFGAAGSGGAGGNASLGTISSVNDSTIYLTDTTGNTVKVTLSPSTKLTKSLSVSKGALHPGDSVVIQGVKSSSGTLVATSVSDSGVRATGSNSTGGTSSSGG